MKKRKIVGTCLVLIFIASIISVQAADYKTQQTQKIPQNGSSRYSFVTLTEDGSGIPGVSLTPWYCWTVAFGRRGNFGDGMELYGAITGDICFRTGVGEEHELTSYWTHTVYFDDGVVEVHQCPTLHRVWSGPITEIPDFMHIKGQTNPNLYTITKIIVHEDKYVDGNYYEYSGTIKASSSSMN